MRKIKFRGKRTDDGEWVYGYLVKTKDSVYICYDGQYDDDLFLSPENILIQVDPATVGQYTGKAVKNGEVCQDDIGKSIDGTFLVVWDEEKAAFMMQFCDGERLYLEEMWDNSEVIGNIHDNPDLLTGGKE